MGALLYLISITNLALYTWVLFQVGKRLHQNDANKRFFLLLIAGLIWIIDSYLFDVEVHSIQTATILAHINYFIAPFVAAFIVSFALHFPKKSHKINLLHEILILAPTVIVSILALFPDLVFTVTDFRDFRAGPLYSLYILVLVSYFVVIAVPLFIRKYLKAEGVYKKQLFYIIWGYSFSIAILLTESLIGNIIGPLNYITSNLMDNASVLFILVVGFAIIKYRFLDLRFILRKGLLYLFSLGLSLAFYTLLILNLRTTIEESWNTSAGWTAAVLILITVAGFIPVKKGVEYVINKMFKGRKSIDLAVAELKRDISEQSDTAALAKLVTAQTRRFLDVGEAHVYLGKPGEELVSYGNGGDRISRDNDMVRYFQKYRDPIVREEIPHMIDERDGEFERDALQKVEKEMKKQKVSIVMPFVHEDGLYGLLTVGERDSREAFTVQDIQFLTKLREEIGFTLASALQYSYAMERIRVMQEKGEL